MKKTQHFALILSLSLLAVACGKMPSAPIALKKITPDNPVGESLPGDPNPNPTLLDEVVAEGVPRALAVLAFDKYDTFSRHVKNKTYMSILDFSAFSGRPRFYLINTNTGHVDALLVAHGVGSDPKATGTPSRFSNLPSSKMSSIGSYLVSEKFHSSKHGTAARLDGLEGSNNLARRRGIILHSASYVSTARAKMGMSWGCTAVSLAWISTTLKRLTGGSFMYAYAQSSQADPFENIQIEQMMNNPAYPWIDESEAAPVDGEF